MPYMKAAGNLRAIADNGATISSTSVGLTDLGFSQTDVNRADSVQLVSYSQPIRYRYTGDTVATTEGHIIVAGEEIVFTGKEIIKNLQMIAESTDAPVWITLSTYGI